MEKSVTWLFDKMTPIDEIIYIYPLLVLNFVNSLTAFIYQPIFYEPNRFCTILALFFFGIVALGMVRSAKKRRASP